MALLLLTGIFTLGAGDAADQSLEYLLSLTSQPGGEPADAPPALSCAWRRYAVEFAAQIQSVSIDRQQQLHDALQLKALCGDSFVAIPTASDDSPRYTPSLGQRVIIVDASKGSDTAPGTLAKPLQSLPAALALSRTQKHGVSDAPAIFLRAGTYRLNTTLVLTPADSGLTIAAYNGETVEVSGGQLLEHLDWTPLAGHKGAYVTTIPKSAGLQGIPALRFEGARATLARYPSIVTFEL